MLPVTAGLLKIGGYIMGYAKRSQLKAMGTVSHCRWQAADFILEIGIVCRE